MPFGELAALGCAVFWSSSNVVMKSQIRRIDVIPINALRYMFSFIFYAVLLWVTHRWGLVISFPRPALAYLMLSMAIGLVTGDTLHLKAIELLGVSRATPIANVYPLFALLLAVVFLGEPITLSIVLGAMAITASLYLIVAPRPHEPRDDPAESAIRKKGTLIALTAAICWACSTILLKLGLQDVDVLVASGIRITAAGVPLVLLAYVRKGVTWFKRERRQGLGMILLASLSGPCVGSLLFMVAVQYAGAGKAAVLTATAPLYAALFSLVFLGEKLTVRLIAGIVLSILGLWLIL
ncbi:MAG: DMT family transporter [Candidatus Latescibacteria bacterium]|nr:DMT family transporter [Candidatus Latescibacterota bacterium]